MIDIPAGEQVGLLTLWLLGVSMGLTACTVTCLPFIGTWALGRASGQREAFRHTAIFLFGRLLTYATLAALAGYAGLGLAKAMGGTWGNGLIGAASILAGLWLLARRGSGCAAPTPPGDVRPLRLHRRRADSLPPLLLGSTLSLTPCTPLASLLALAAHAGSAAQGAAYGLAFGLGAVMTPILILVPLAGRLGREFRAGRRWVASALRWSAALVLVVLGLRRLLIVWPV